MSLPLLYRPLFKRYNETWWWGNPGRMRLMKHLIRFIPIHLLCSSSNFIRPKALFSGKNEFWLKKNLVKIDKGRECKFRHLWCVFLLLLPHHFVFFFTSTRDALLVDFTQVSHAALIRSWPWTVPVYGWPRQKCCLRDCKLLQNS